VKKGGPFREKGVDLKEKVGLYFSRKRRDSSKGHHGLFLSSS